MRNLLKGALVVFVSLILTLCMIEIVLRATGIATDTPWAQGNPLLGFSFVPNQTGTWVVGKWGENKAEFHINSDGWNAVRHYVAQRDPAITRVAVIGDSYVEALNVRPTAAMAAVLERALIKDGKRIEVYPFGIASASASHYLAMMRYVRNRFYPDLYVINIVHNDIQDSLGVVTSDRTIYFSVRRTPGFF